MKPHLITKTVTSALSLILWLLAPQTAHCFYNPSTGRWLSRDALDENGGLNLYAFVKSPLDQHDNLGLCTCCECAEDIGITLLDLVYPARGPDQLGSYFVVKIYLSYKDGNGKAKLQWWEKTNIVPPFELQHGAKPNQWYDSYAISSTGFGHWNKRQQTPCNVGRVVEEYDTPFINKSIGYRYVEWDILVFNPPQCNCERPWVKATAMQTIDPNANPPIAFAIPDPME